MLEKVSHEDLATDIFLSFRFSTSLVCLIILFFFISFANVLTLFTWAIFYDICEMCQMRKNN